MYLSTTSEDEKPPGDTDKEANQTGILKKKKIGNTRGGKKKIKSGMQKETNQGQAYL